MDKVAATTDVDIVLAQTRDHIVNAIGQGNLVVTTGTEVQGFNQLQRAIRKELCLAIVAQNRVNIIQGRNDIIARSTDNSAGAGN